MTTIFVAVAVLAACSGTKDNSSADSGNAAADSGQTGTDSGQTDTDADESDAVFDTTFVHRVDLSIDAAAWSDISNDPWAETWYTADFALDGETVRQVGVRAYGGASRVPGKPNVKIGFDRVVDGQEFRNLEQLKLDGSVQDPGFLNEAVATGVLRDLGLPAARTGWAVLYVNGTRSGFYVMLEPIDDKFVQRWFGEDDGTLYGTVSGMYAQGLNRFTTTRPLDWYEVAFGAGDGSDIEAAADAIAFGTEEDLEAVLDTETTMRISATRALMGSTDSFVSDANNFYLYNHDGRIVVLPWDFDVELGGYSPVFYNMVVMEMERPWEYSHWRPNSITGEPYTEPLYERKLAEGWDLDGWMDTVTSGPLEWSAADARIQGYAALIEADACADNYHSCTSHTRRVADLRMFLHARLSYLAGAEVAECPPDPGLEFYRDGVEVARDVTDWGHGFVVNGDHYCHGVWAIAPSELTSEVVAGALTGEVGLADWAQMCAAEATFTIQQDGATLWSSASVGPYEDPVPFAVEVGAGTVRLVAQQVGEGCAEAVWLGLAQ